ncbi:MAG: hypothetical protein R3E82_12360 [Pseudomonadales bacterium]|nr:hypothetical protein [Pseudomonadales bacterium]
MTSEKQYWLDRPQNVRKLYLGLWFFGMAWVIPDFFLHKHEDVEFAATYAFYAIFGFFACVALVVTAKGLRRILMRPEDYYDR